MNNDTHLIWEQFERRAAVQRQKRRYVTESVIQEQITSRLIEEILIEEGLMDTIKGAGQKVAGAVKNIGQAVNDRVLQPILKKAVDWLAQNDPDTLVSVMGAAEEGPEALDQLVGAEGGDQVEQQIANAPQAVNESVDLYKEILREHILYLHNEGLLSKIGQGIGNMGRKAKQGIDYVNQNAPEWKKQAQQGLQNVKQNVQQGVADLRQGVQQGYSGEQPGEDPDSNVTNMPAKPGMSNATPQNLPATPGMSDATPQNLPATPNTSDEAPEQPAAGGDQKQGLISKIVGWVKENPNMSKGIAMGIFGAANLALGAGLATALAPMAGGYAIGGGIAGVMEYRKLRQQGMEPKEALAQAAKAANEKGLTAGMFAGGASLIGNIAGKIMGGGDAAAPQQQAQPGEVGQGPSGQVQDVGAPNDSFVPGKTVVSPDGDVTISSSGYDPADIGDYGGMGPNSSQEWLKAARQGKRVMPDELDYFQEGILKRPGWVNKKIN